MSTPHYVAQRVGDEYVLVRTDGSPVFTTSRLFLFGGVATGVAAALTRGKTQLALAGAAGAMLLAWGTGAFGGGGRPGNRPATHGAGPSFSRDIEARRRGTAQRPADDVEEASMESFPASDPPARHSSTAAQ